MKNSETRIVKFNKDWRGFTKNQITEFDRDFAYQMLSSGLVAETTPDEILGYKQKKILAEKEAAKAANKSIKKK